MHVTAIVLAAGKGLRLSRFNSFTVRSGIPTHISKMIGSGRSKISKPLIKIDSKPIIIYSLNILGKHPCIKDIIVVANPRNLQDIRKTIKRFRIDKIKDVVLGGEVRRASVAKGLEAIDSHTDLVLIHDGVRPFIDKEMVSSVIKTAKSYGAAIVGVPVKATIKSVKVSLPVRQAGKCQSVKVKECIVDKTLNRSRLWEIQTPQVFRKDLILKAYDKFGDIDVTDDAMLVEKLGAKVSVVRGTYSNIKITTPEDLVIAQAIAKAL